MGGECIDLMNECIFVGVLVANVQSGASSYFCGYKNPTWGRSELLKELSQSKNLTLSTNRTSKEFLVQD